MKKKTADTLATSVAKKVGTALGTLAATTKTFIDQSGLTQAEKAEPAPQLTRARSAKKAAKKRATPKKATTTATKDASKDRKKTVAKKRAARGK